MPTKETGSRGFFLGVGVRFSDGALLLVGDEG